MPPIRTRTGGPLRRLLFLALAAAVALGLYAFVQLGPWLAREDPLRKADAIFVLAGTRMVRPLEAADLYREDYAPIIVMTRDVLEPEAYQAIAGRGIRIEPDVDRARDAFVSFGIPREAILIPDQVHDNTAAEAITLRALAARHGWRRIIVVTSRFHLTRAGYAMRRELRGSGIEIVMRPSRYDTLRPDGWWRRRAEVRWVMSEFPKLVAYACGLGA